MHGLFIGDTELPEAKAGNRDFFVEADPDSSEGT
jgi:hypothetical protein